MMTYKNNFINYINSQDIFGKEETIERTKKNNKGLNMNYFEHILETLLSAII